MPPGARDGPADVLQPAALPEPPLHQDGEGGRPRRHGVNKQKE